MEFGDDTVLSRSSLFVAPLASALMLFRSAKRGLVMPSTLSRLAACVACLPATPCLSLRARHISRLSPTCRLSQVS